MFMKLIDPEEQAMDYQGFLFIINIHNKLMIYTNLVWNINYQHSGLVWN
jgi:hypothetical protein